MRPTLTCPLFSMALTSQQMVVGLVFYFQHKREIGVDFFIWRYKNYMFK